MTDQSTTHGMGSPAQPGTPPVRHHLFRAKYVSEYALVILIVLLGVILSLTAENFAQVSNLWLVLDQTSTLLIVSLPFALVLMTRYIDLSIGSALAVYGVIAAKLMGAVGSWVQWNPWLVSAIVIGLGLIYGASQGWLVTAWAFNPFVLSVGLLAAMRGLAFLLEGGRYAEDLPHQFLYLGQSRIRGLEIPLSVVIATVIALIAYFYLHNTRHGRHTQAIAGNARASFLVGIPVNRRIVILYAVLGAAVALAALMTASALSAGPASIGNGFELQVLTAVLLGGVAFEGGRGTVMGVILGAVFINMFNNGLLMWGVSSNASYFINGAILAAAAGLPAFSSRMAARQAGKQAREART